MCACTCITVLHIVRFILAAINELYLKNDLGSFHGNISYIRNEIYLWLLMLPFTSKPCGQCVTSVCQKLATTKKVSPIRSTFFGDFNSQK